MGMKSKFLNTLTILLLMERGALCAICGGPALPAYTCRLCGAIVCAKDFSVETGLCRICEAKRKQKQNL